MRRPSASMIVALIALFVALSGTAVAGSSLMTGKQIKDHSIGIVDLSSTAVAKLHGARGPAGPQGQQGAQGPSGPAGANGLNGLNGGFDPNKVTYVTGPSKSFAPGDIGFVFATCPAGTKVIAGGFFANIMHVAGNQGYGGANSWAALISNDTSISVDANATAVCAAP